MLGGDAACHHIANCGGMACQKNGITQHITKQPDGQRRTEPRPWVRCVRFVEVRTTGFRISDMLAGKQAIDSLVENNMTAKIMVVWRLRVDLRKTTMTRSYTLS